METRDAEIRRLKRDNEKLQEETKGFAFHNADPHSPLKELAGLQLGDSDHYDGRGGGVDIGMMSGEWVEQEDFSDVITSQAEINRLRSELSELRKELHYLKTMAKDEVCACMHVWLKMRCVHACMCACCTQFIGAYVVSVW